jgi:two-component system response regulator HydG
MSKMVHMKKILVVDDDTYICNLVSKFLAQNGYETQTTFSGNEAIKSIKKTKFDLVICDFRLPDSDGLAILQQIKKTTPETPVIIMTAYADVKMAVKLIKSGAYDYLTKPLQHEEMLALVKSATEKKTTTSENNTTVKDFIVGKSDIIQEVMHHIDMVAPTELTVLVEGETGSGKEFIARLIHERSTRKNKPFVAVDCGALPKDIANSELFGHVKGAFTGAINNKKGYFEQAKGGTLFLDEIGNLTYDNQTRLLRALQERVISKLGDEKDINVDVRLIAATNDNLSKQVADSDFRQDLYHRLNEFKISLPPLRERKEDISEFVEFFIEKSNKTFNRSVLGVNEATMELFLNYKWHGNIRELENVIKRAVLLSKSEYIIDTDLPDEIRLAEIHEVHTPALHKNKASLVDLKEATEITEKEVIYNALVKSNFNKSKAAKMLNIDRKTLYNKIKLYDLNAQNR